MDKRLKVLIALVACAGAALLALGASRATGEDLKALIVLAVLGVLAERYSVGLFKSYVSVGAVAVLIAAVVSGVWGVALVAPCAVLGGGLRTQLAWYKRVFNLGTYLVSGAAFVGIFRAFGYNALPGEWPQVLAPALIGALVNFAINSALVATAVGLSERRSVAGVWKENYLWLLPQYLVVGLAAMSAATAYEMIGLWGFAVFAAPVLGIRHAYSVGARKPSPADVPLPKAA